MPSLDEYFDRLEWAPAAVNVASYAGHGTLREAVMGADYRRAASAAEVAKMAELLEREMAAGALGLSTGLEYDPGIYSERSELVTLAKVAARHGGRYISHVRSEDRWFWEAIDERQVELIARLDALNESIEAVLAEFDRPAAATPPQEAA